MTQPQKKMIPLYSFGGKEIGMIDVEAAKQKARDGDLSLRSNGKQGRRYRVTAAYELPKATGWRPMDSGGYTVLQLET
jgi:hypothetical protein